MTPFLVNRKTVTAGYQISKEPVPCGKCPACKKRRTSAWSFRLMQEEKISSSAYFITLTYDTKNVPITENGFMAISKDDVQRFFKRLRKLQSEQIKYFAVGEYGGKTMRPHYHVILFNAKVETIQDAWQLGSVHYGTVSGASVGYTLKYICKSSKIPIHKNDDRTKEFALMSKGLGEAYLTENMRQWHHADKNNRMYCNLQDGKKISMPRYYKEKVYSEYERKTVGYHTRAAMLKKKEKDQGNDPDYYKNKFAADEMAFRKMHKDETKGEIL